MKLFVIYQKISNRRGHNTYAGYFICEDCDDYLCTGWVIEKKYVWEVHSDIYSMKVMSTEEGSNAFGWEPVDIFIDWIKNDLKGGEMLPP